MKRKVVIITDLDGSLLHPVTYSFKEAAQALDLIKKLGIPLILSSSKTRAEIELYKNRLGNTDPFVSENGGGIFIPKDYFPFDIEGTETGNYTVINIGTPYVDVRNVFKQINTELGANAVGFGDLTVNEIAKITNMTQEEASLSKKREFDEPFLLNGNNEEKEVFIKTIKEKGYSWTEGRFLHILGAHDKGKAANTLKEFYKKENGHILSIGIGDSLNDIPLLEEVDYPILIPKESGNYIEASSLDNLIKAEFAGPKGWDMAVRKVLKNIGGI